MSNPTQPQAKKAGDSVAKRGVWSRFSWPMHNIAIRAQQELSSTIEGKITPVQLLRGIVTTQACNGYKILEMMHVMPESLAIRLQAENANTIWPPPPTKAVAGKTTLHFSQDTTRLLNTSAEEAKQFGHLRIGTEHVLLALLTGNYEGASNILAEYGITADSYRSAFGRLLMSGQYKLETPQATDPLAAGQVQAATGRIGWVSKIRNWAQIAYVIGIIVLFYTRYFSPGFGGAVIGSALSVIVDPLFIFIWPYFFSSYALSWVLRSRAEKGLTGQPLGTQFQSIGLQMGVCIFFGLIISIGALAGGAMAAVSSGRVILGGPEAIAGVVIAFLMELIVWILAVTHWLLTFDKRG